MSVVKKGTNTGLYTYQSGTFADPRPRVNQYGQLTWTLNGTTVLLDFDAPRGCGAVRLRWNGVDLLKVATDHGSGIEFAHNALPTGEVVSTNVCSPTEQGSQVDGSSSSTGSSNNLYRSFYASLRRVIRKTRPAYWMQPNQVTVPSHPALNLRTISRFDTTVDINVGFGGDDHIIQWLTDVEVPVDSLIQSFQQLDIVCNSIIGDSTLLTVAEYVNPATGATRAYPGFPDTSQTEVVMFSNAGATIALAPFQPLGEWGPTGYAQALVTGVSDTFIRAREVSGSIAPGRRRYNPYTVMGTRADVLTALQALNAANITRSTDILLPDVV